MAKTAKKKAPAGVAAKKPKKGQAAKDTAERTKRGALGLKKVDRKGAAAKASRAEAGRKMPSAGQLRGVIEAVQTAMDKAKSLNGKGRQAISEAVADFSLNKVAFSMVRKMIKIGTEDPNKLMVMLEDLDHYRRVLKVDDLAGPGLFAGATGAETTVGGEDGDEGEEDDETVIPDAPLGEERDPAAPIN